MSCWESLLYLPTFPYPCQPVLHNCCPHHSQQHQQRFLSSPQLVPGGDSSPVLPWRGFSGKHSSSPIFGKRGRLHLPSSSRNHVFRLSAQLPERMPVVIVSTTESTRFLPNFGLLACLLVYNSRILVSEFIFHPGYTPRNSFKICHWNAWVASFSRNFVHKTLVTTLKSFSNLLY